jgi:hypothetical protein
MRRRSKAWPCLHCSTCCLRPSTLRAHPGPVSGRNGGTNTERAKNERSILAASCSLATISDIAECSMWLVNAAATGPVNESVVMNPAVWARSQPATYPQHCALLTRRLFKQEGRTGLETSVSRLIEYRLQVCLLLRIDSCHAVRGLLARRERACRGRRVRRRAVTTQERR